MDGDRDRRVVPGYPFKFTADSLTRPVALDVGRATFHALAYLEWALIVVLGVVEVAKVAALGALGARATPTAEASHPHRTLESHP